MTTFTDAPWDGSASNYKDTDAYCSACLIDQNDGSGPKVQAKCKLPYKTPSGAVSKGALRAISGALQGSRGGVEASPDDKRAAAKKIIPLMKEAKIDVGDGLYKVAGMQPPA